MGALQIVVMRWQGRSSSPRADAAAHRRLRRSAIVGATIAAVAVGAFAVTRLSERPARSVSSDKPPTLNHEVLSSTNANGEATVRVRNLDAFSWTRVRVFVSQGDEHVYACEVPPVVPPRGALTIDLGRCLSDEGLTVDTTRPVSTFAVRAAEGSIDSRRQ